MKIYFIAFLAATNTGCFPWKTPPTPVARALPANAHATAEMQALDRPQIAEIVKACPLRHSVDSASGRLTHEKRALCGVEEDIAGTTWKGAKDGDRAAPHWEAPATFAKGYEISRAHLAAIAEQNAVLEKKIRALEKEHERCSEGQRPGKQKTDPSKSDDIAASTRQTLEKAFVPFRIEPLLSGDPAISSSGPAQ
ncbi:MAG: hypothetical protein C5B47_07105 [Verrucomicrobia bacterium]|nr:MAG: hypothetical protein C5B47_07105 [Verrucomicrobiota bacterium]